MDSKLKILLQFIIEELTTDKEAINIKEIVKERRVTYKVRVKDGELGRVIGKNGITAGAIRSVMQAAAIKEDINVDVEFLD